MSLIIRPPIVLDDNGDIEVYPDVDSASGALEVVDVEEGVYDAFDSDGNRLTVKADAERISIERRDDLRNEVEDLDRRLRAYVNRVGAARVGIDASVATLAELVQALLRFQAR